MLQTNTEIEWFAFFDITPDLVCIASKEGYFKKVNPSVIKKMGYTAEELFARPISSFIDPDDQPLTAGKRALLLEGEHLVDFENRYITKSGEILWLYWTSVYQSDKEIIFAIAKDITSRKKAEMEIEHRYKRLESMASHFKHSSEKDRKYFAYELQEELAQLAAVVKMDVDWLAGHVSGQDELAKTRLEHAVGVSALMIKTIQRISFAISPKMLYDFGLDSTLEWLCKEFSLLNNIACRFESDYDENTLSQELRTDFFRICQEALTNVSAHAQASQVNIRIETEGDCIVLTITDDGKGFDSSQTTSGYGLINIRERVASIYGDVKILSEEGKGTCVRVEVAAQTIVNNP